MDRFTRNAVIGSGVITVLLILSVLPWGGMAFGPRIWQLNDVLKQDPILAEYPYEFKALLFLNGIVTLTRPYDAGIAMNEVLMAMDPTLAGKPADDPAVVAARDRLQRMEFHAIGLMLAEPDVDSIVWSPDRAWLNRQGIDFAPPVQALGGSM
ncbi:hypothetical protein [Thiocapsa marina]|uniref:Uncharacterized protein n=1 Tax=Thiocapsa marina 5811 TaxID=768671 RepID=F9UIN9_9GAMM|nr:hypothetical protein [Thiocapsa marina]EGV15921.1 hypothetical protein ThimaDRAFT_4792 [Thiocapsa marina 5811]